MKDVPTSGLYLFKSCLVSTEYPGVESSLRFIWNRLGIDYISDPRQSCCTGLGYYFDVFDHLSTVAVAARNLSLAQELDYRNLVKLCATCYAVNKNAIRSLHENPGLASQVSGMLEKIGLSYPDKMDAKNVFHEVDILAALKNKIAYAAADLAGANRLSYHGGIKIICVLSTLRVRFEHIKFALAQGAGGVFLGEGSSGDSRKEQMAKAHAQVYRSKLHNIGINPRRLEYSKVYIPAHHQLVEGLNKFYAEISYLDKREDFSRRQIELRSSL